METQKLSPGKFGVNYGVILGLILVLISVIMYVTGMQLEGVEWPIYLFYLIFPITIFYAINQFKKRNGNLLKLGEALKTGLIVGIMSAIVFAIYNLIFNYIIDPGYMGQIMELEKEKLMENPNMTEQMVDQSMKYIEIVSSPLVMTALWLALSAFFALIYSLIAGLIMKKEVPQH